jgi:ribosomal protein S18 acetylase RimI-like enzyme
MRRTSWRPCSGLPSDPQAAGLRIRAASPRDAATLARVHRESWRTTYAGILPLEIVARESGRKSEGAWRGRLAASGDLLATWLAELPGEGIVGFASCGPAREPLEGLEAEIYALYVLQSCQRRGTGRALVHEAARHFVRHGCFGFYLWVLKANRARMFYEALGGQEIAERTERLGKHPFAEVAYGWHDLSRLVGAG